MAPNGCVKKHLKGLGTVGTVRFRLDSVAKCIINLKKQTWHGDKGSLAHFCRNCHFSILQNKIRKIVSPQKACVINSNICTQYILFLRHLAAFLAIILGICLLSFSVFLSIFKFVLLYLCKTFTK